MRATYSDFGADGQPRAIALRRADGSLHHFWRNADGYWYIKDSSSRVERIARISPTRYEYRAPNGVTETYSWGGSIISIANAQGVRCTFEYGSPDFAGSDTVVNPALTRVVHAGGRSVSFTWSNVGGRWVVSRVTDPAGNAYQYGYTSGGLLASVTYPAVPRYVGSTSVFADVVTYHREAPPLYGWLVTGKSINGVRFSRFAYDTQHRAISTERAGGVERVAFDYSVAGQTTVTNALGRRTIFRYDNQRRITSVDGLASLYCPATSASTTYVSATERIEATEDGYRRRFLLDGNGNVYREEHGIGTTTPRVIQREWHPIFRWPLAETTPLKRTNWEYDGSHRLRAARVTNLSANGVPGETLVTQYAYADANQDGIPEQITIDGPAPGAGDAITLSYNAQGDLVQTSSNSAIETFGGHNGLGLPTVITDASGVQTTIQYDARGRIIAAVRNGVRTAQTFSHFGAPLQTQDAFGRVTQWSYDAAGRLSGTRAGRSFALVPGYVSGDATSLTYDAASNVTRVAQETYSAYGAYPAYESDYQVHAFEAQLRDFDELGRVRAVRGHSGQQWKFGYTAGGLLSTVTDVTGRMIETNGFDEHLQRITSIDAAGKATRYGYDAEGRITSVTDPRGNVTRYGIDGFGLVRSISSPDTGVTSFGYNGYGQLTSASYANGRTLAQAYRS